MSDEYDSELDYTQINSVENAKWTGEYRNICLSRPPEYSFYGQLEISWGNMQDYQCHHKLGRGKYSEVYQGANANNEEKCVIKILKPVKIEKIYREIKILETLYGGPNIIKLYDILKETVSKTPCFVYEYMPNIIETKKLIPSLSDHDNRLYLYKLLMALDYCHSQGIMHRDVKPLNIVINNQSKQLRLIDWGLADYYKPD
jgi:casein kinase II subunit alpha